MKDERSKQFWLEVKQIKQRHKLFFAEEQMKFIRLKKSGDQTELEIDEDHDLDQVLIAEI